MIISAPCKSEITHRQKINWGDGASWILQFLHKVVKHNDKRTNYLILNLLNIIFLLDFTEPRKKAAFIEVKRI